MDANRKAVPQESDDAAINQVLEAERAAREAIARARTQAAELVAAAREKARRINERADARVGLLRAACQRRIAERAAELQRAAEALHCTTVEQDQRYRRLADAVARLAAALGGGSP